MRVYLALLIFCAGFLTPAAAQNLDNQCAIIIASRPSPAEARHYILQNNWQEDAEVFQTQNGWYAITLGLVARKNAADILRRGKTGRYPSDAFCGNIDAFIEYIDWRDVVDTRPISRGLWAEFDARPLGPVEKRAVQAALAMNGYYWGLLDGEWGTGSQTALEMYTANVFDRSTPLNADAAFLFYDLSLKILDEGWQERYIPWLGLSFLVPEYQMYLQEQRADFEHWENSSGDLSIVILDITPQSLLSFHEVVRYKDNQIYAPYIVENRDRWVSMSQTPLSTHYIRSDYIGASWSTVLINGTGDARNDLWLIASSIQQGRLAQIIPGENSLLSEYLAELHEEADLNMQNGRKERLPDMPRAQPEPTPSEPSTTGTAFYITAQGMALTNAHVVEACTRIEVDGQAANLVANSTFFDLALLQLAQPTSTPYLSFSHNDPALNADVTIAGYPLHGLLGGLNISRGSVSSLRGLYGDEINVQISAPVQPGNSGGPMVDRTGAVTGVVVAKLDAQALAEQTGDIAQNINFAIRGSAAKLFLASNNISYTDKPITDALAPEVIAQMLSTTTKLVECY